MTSFKVVTHEDVPKNRLLVLTVQGKTEDDDRTRIRLAEEGEIPDFVSTGEVEEGKEITIRFTDKKTWKVESAEDIRSGVSVGIGAEGKIVESLDGSVPTIGYSNQAYAMGDVVSYVRNVKGGDSTPGPKGDTGPKGDPGKPGTAGKDGATGPAGFGTEAQYNDIIERIEALETPEE